MNIPCLFTLSLVGCSLLDQTFPESLYSLCRDAHSWTEHPLHSCILSDGMLTLETSIPCILVLSLDGCFFFSFAQFLTGWFGGFWIFLLIVFIYKLNIFAIFIYIIMLWWSHHSMHVGVRERPVGVVALLALCQVWGSGGFVCWDILSEPQSLEALLTCENSLYSRNGSVLGLVLHTSFLICNCLFFLESFTESEIISMRSRSLSLVKSSVPVLPNSSWCSALCLWSL